MFFLISFPHYRLVSSLKRKRKKKTGNMFNVRGIRFVFTSACLQQILALFLDLFFSSYPRGTPHEEQMCADRPQQSCLALYDLLGNQLACVFNSILCSNYRLQFRITLVVTNYEHILESFFFEKIVLTHPSCRTSHIYVCV